ncbi:MAG: hypothetical protein IKS07_10660, partial [Lachnospiraceae bacterium]|nr:hypothetical protein [Lachnospiraceae bacterium]
QDGAWQFVRYYLTPEYQNTEEDEYDYEIPVLSAAFDQWIENGSKRNSYEDENGNKVEYEDTYYVDGVEKTIPNMTASDKEAFRQAILNCHRRYFYDNDIRSIIEEEASAVFAKQKTASDVASIIQSRVQLYVNENS